MPENTLFSYTAAQPLDSLLNLDNSVWSSHDQVNIDRDWMGRSMLREKGIGWKNLTQAASVWNDEWIVFRFDCWYDMLNIDSRLSVEGSAQGLWERDVVEIFLRPEACEDYFEVEVSPLAQCLDAHIRAPRVDVDYRWSSGVKVNVEIDKEEKIWRLVAALPFGPLVSGRAGSRPPVVGEVWRMNLCRVAGEEPDREYLAWRPTFTPRPDFHLPSSFGNLFFLGE